MTPNSRPHIARMLLISRCGSLFSVLIMHTHNSTGVTDHLAVDEPHALAIAREIVRNLPPPPLASTSASAAAAGGGGGGWAPAAASWDEPLLPPEGLRDLLPNDPSGAAGGGAAGSNNASIDVRAVLERTLDGSRFDEFKANYGETLVCGFGALHGQPVGVVANAGVLLSQSALKGCHFIELCCQRRVPLLFMQNITGEQASVTVSVVD